MRLVGYYEVHRHAEQIWRNVVLGVGLSWVGSYACREKMKIEGTESVIVWRKMSSLGSPYVVQQPSLILR